MQPDIEHGMARKTSKADAPGVRVRQGVAIVAVRRSKVDIEIDATPPI
jgi:hypothetical protein